MIAMRTISVPPYDIAAIEVPVVIGYGAETSAHHQRAAKELAGWRGESAFVIDGAKHGAHYSHRREFAAFVELVCSKRVTHGAEPPGH
jgi:hypothetical protein